MVETMRLFFPSLDTPSRIGVAVMDASEFYLFFLPRGMYILGPRYSLFFCMATVQDGGLAFWRSFKRRCSEGFFILFYSFLDFSVIWNLMTCSHLVSIWCLALGLMSFHSYFQFYSCIFIGWVWRYQKKEPRKSLVRFFPQYAVPLGSLLHFPVFLKRSGNVETLSTLHMKLPSEASHLGPFMLVKYIFPFHMRGFLHGFHVWLFWPLLHLAKSVLFLFCIIGGLEEHGLVIKK